MSNNSRVSCEMYANKIDILQPINYFHQITLLYNIRVALKANRAFLLKSAD